MKKSILKSIQQLMAVIILNFVALAAAAQDSTIQTTTNANTSSTETTFHVQPWMWIVGAAMLLIIIIALLRGKGSDTTVSRTTVIKDRS